MQDFDTFDISPQKSRKAQGQPPKPTTPKPLNVSVVDTPTPPTRKPPNYGQFHSSPFVQAKWSIQANSLASKKE